MEIIDQILSKKIKRQNQQVDKMQLKNNKKDLNINPN